MDYLTLVKYMYSKMISASATILFSIYNFYLLASAPYDFWLKNLHLNADSLSKTFKDIISVLQWPQPL